MAIHPFTESGFGPGPFTVIYMRDASKVGLEAQDHLLAGNCNCHHCHTFIRWAFGIRCQTTGNIREVGSSCVEKTDPELYQMVKERRREYNRMMREEAAAKRAEQAQIDIETRFNDGLLKHDLLWALDLADSNSEMFEIKRIRDILAAAKKFGFNPDSILKLKAMRIPVERRMLAASLPHGSATIGKGTFTGEIVACWASESMYGLTTKIRVWDLQNNTVLICTAPRALLDLDTKGFSHRNFLCGQQVTLQGEICAPYRPEPGAAYTMKRPRMVNSPLPLPGWFPAEYEAATTGEAHEYA